MLTLIEGAQIHSPAPLWPAGSAGGGWPHRLDGQGTDGSGRLATDAGGRWRPLSGARTGGPARPYHREAAARRLRLRTPELSARAALAAGSPRMWRPSAPTA